MNIPTKASSRLGTNYAWESLYSAIHDALLCEGPVQQRLAACYPDFHEMVLRQELPAALLPRFDAIMAACTREPDTTGMHGAFAATTEKMSHAEARKWLEELLNLYDEVTRRDAVEWEQTKSTSLSHLDHSF